MKVVSELKKVLGREKYSNLNLAFNKLHAIREVLNNNAELDKKKFLDNLLKNLDDEYLKDGVHELKRSIDTAVSGFSYKEIEADVGYRFVMGMGYPSPVENGFLLHPVYGIPFISGESVKGLTRYVFCENLTKETDTKKLKENVEKLEEEKFEDEELQNLYTHLFGTRNREGLIIYFDAYPISLSRENFVIDIMNPHYGEYYKSKGKNPPADWDKPNPIFFLVLEGVRFRFSIGYDPLRLEEKEGEELLDIAISCLKRGLEIYGLGAKRRKGYGWFEVHQKREETVER